jgi:glycosyltransferase involved in cell wall biosynthesis
MRVLLAAASVSSQISGVQRHALNVARALLTRSEVSEVRLIVAPWQLEMVKRSGMEANPRLSVACAAMERSAFSRNRWFYREVPRLAKSFSADVAHLAYPVPVDAAAFTCATVVTLHDLYPYEIPSNFGFPKVMFNRLILQQCLRSVDAIACVSEVTQQRLHEYVPKRVSAKATRIYNCVEAETVCAVASPFTDWDGSPFLLCVAQHRRNKNIPFLLDVFARLTRAGQIDPNTRLVVVGISGPETSKIVSAVKIADMSKSVVFAEGLSDAELQWCYRNCGAVLAPSTIEGFGLPVAEALLAGCPVVCSDIPAFRELGGNDCRYVRLDRNAEAAFAAAVVAVLREPRKGAVALPALGPSVIAEQYVRLYSKLRTTDAARHLVMRGSARAAVTERSHL